MKDLIPSFEQRLQLNYIRVRWAKFLEENNLVASIDSDTGELCLTTTDDSDKYSLVTLREDLSDYEDVD